MRNYAELIEASSTIDEIIALLVELQSEIGMIKFSIYEGESWMSLQETYGFNDEAIIYLIEELRSLIKFFNYLKDLEFCASSSTLSKSHPTQTCRERPITLQGDRVGDFRLQPVHPGPLLENPQSSSPPCFETSPIVQESHISSPSPSPVDWKEQALSSELHSGDSKGLVEFSRDRFELNPQFSSSLSTDVHSSDRNLNVTLQQKIYLEHLNVADLLSNELTYARLDAGKPVKDVTNSRGENILGPAQIESITSCQTVVTPDAAVQASSLEGLFDSAEILEDLLAIIEGNHINSRHMLIQIFVKDKLYKWLVSTAREEDKGPKILDYEGQGVIHSVASLGYDSFGRWMDREIGGDCDKSLMASDSGNYWNTLDTDNGENQVKILSRHMQLDTDSLGPSLSQEQLVSLSEFTPDWVCSGMETKVLIIGTFLGHGKHPTCQKWSCMFGEVDVAAEILIQSILRCQVHSHAPGCLPIYVTCRNRLACSKVREIEYREKPSELALALRPSNEVRLQARLAKLLHSGLSLKFFDCSRKESENCTLKTLICSLKYESGSVAKILEDFMNILDDEGQGIIHLGAALGYEWGLLPLIAAGISPNLRDACGRTALHWATQYGREDMVIALVKLGVAAGAVDDPTAAFPGGQTVADLAFSGSHKGIAGYLAESDLIAHLQSLFLNNNDLDDIGAGLEAEKAFESAAQEVSPLVGLIGNEISLKESLASLRRSAHAAALIQAAFRAFSFHQRQLTDSKIDVSEASLDLVALSSLNKVKKTSHFKEYLHSDATKIQQKYRGWKGKRNFLKIRNQIVKSRAHVRGHKIRKQYKNDKYKYLSIGRKKKSARVQSMVPHPEARDQYMRLVAKFESSKLDGGGSSK